MNRQILGVLLLLCLATPVLADDWPQWRGPNRDGTWNETGIVERLPGPQIPIKWRAPIGSGYCGPTVSEGRVLVSDRIAKPNQQERVHCFDAESGKSIWTMAYDCSYRGVEYTAGPRAAISIDQGRAYALGTMGHLHCLSLADGRVLWKKNPQADYKARVPIWGIAAAPLVDGDLVVVQVGDEDGGCLIALDKQTGQERWRALDDPASYSAPIVINQAGRRVLVAWTGANVVGLDPASGKVLWKYPFEPARMVINVPTPVVDGDRLFVSAFYDGALMLRLRQDQPAVEEIWRRKGQNERITDALHAMIGTPYFEGDYVYGVDSYGQFRCLDSKTGDRLWEDITAVPTARWATIHMVKNGKRMWMFNERGELLIAELSPQGLRQLSRAKLIEPTSEQLRQRPVCWSHPAYADKHVFARNDRELVCASLAARNPEPAQSR